MLTWTFENSKIGVWNIFNWLYYKILQGFGNKQKALCVKYLDTVEMFRPSGASLGNFPEKGLELWTEVGWGLKSRALDT